MMGLIDRGLQWADDRPLALSCVAIVVAAGVSVLMAGVAGFGAVRSVLAHMAPVWLALIVPARAASYLGYAAAYRRTTTLGAGADESPDTSLETVAFGAAATSLRGGFSIDRRVLRAVGASRQQADVRVLTLSALEYAVLAPAAWICALTLLGSPEVQRVVTVPWAVCVPVGFGLALWAAARFGPGFRAGGRLRRALAEGMKALNLLRELLQHPLESWAAWLGMAVYWAGDVLTLWAALRAVGLHTSAAVVILGYATGYAFTPRTLPLAGVGITEVLLPLALVWVGLPLANAVVAVFVYRITRLVLSIPPAMVARRRVQQLLGAPAAGAG